MKKNLFYTVMMMAVMAVVTISFTACGGSDSDDPLDNTGPDYSVVGIWQITELPEGKGDMKVGDQIVITADGKIYDKTDQLGTWAKGGQCYLTDSEEYPVPFTVKVLSLTENSMSIDITIYGMTFNMKFKRVADIPVVPDNNQNEQGSSDISAYTWPCLEWESDVSRIKEYMGSSMELTGEGDDIYGKGLVYRSSDEKYYIAYLLRATLFQVNVNYQDLSHDNFLKIISQYEERYNISFEKEYYEGFESYQANCNINRKNCIAIAQYGIMAAAATLSFALAE